MAGGGAELALAALKAFPLNSEVAWASLVTIVTLLKGGRQRTLAARLRWAGATDALCAALLAFPSNAKVQLEALRGLASLSAGGSDPSAGPAARAAGAEARAAAALAAFPAHADIQVISVHVLACLGHPSEGAPFAPATLRSAAAALATAAALAEATPEWRKALPEVCNALATITAITLRSVRAPGGAASGAAVAAQRELAGTITVAAELLLTHARDPKTASELCLIIKNVCEGSPGAEVGRAVAAVALARSLYGERSGNKDLKDSAALASAKAQAALEAAAAAAAAAAGASNKKARRRHVSQAAAATGAASPTAASAAADGGAAPPPPPPAPQHHCACSHCGRVGRGLKLCSLCKVAKYCDATCQRAAWSAGGHKATCPGAIAGAAAKAKK